jgi:hypothetical protein
LVLLVPLICLLVVRTQSMSNSDTASSSSTMKTPLPNHPFAHEDADLDTTTSTADQSSSSLSSCWMRRTIQDRQHLHLELYLRGINRTIHPIEQRQMGIALIVAFNQVAGGNDGCQDNATWKRWMYNATLLQQKVKRKWVVAVALPEDDQQERSDNDSNHQSPIPKGPLSDKTITTSTTTTVITNDDSNSSLPILVTRFATDISCHQCVPQEAFASLYPPYFDDNDGDEADSTGSASPSPPVDVDGQQRRLRKGQSGNAMMRRLWSPWWSSTYRDSKNSNSRRNLLHDQSASPSTSSSSSHQRRPSFVLNAGHVIESMERALHTIFLDFQGFEQVTVSLTMTSATATPTTDQHNDDDDDDPLSVTMYRSSSPSSNPTIRDMEAGLDSTTNASTTTTTTTKENTAANTFTSGNGYRPSFARNPIFTKVQTILDCAIISRPRRQQKHRNTNEKSAKSSKRNDGGGRSSKKTTKGDDDDGGAYYDLHHTSSSDYIWDDGDKSSKKSGNGEDDDDDGDDEYFSTSSNRDESDMEEHSEVEDDDDGKSDSAYSEYVDEEMESDNDDDESMDQQSPTFVPTDPLPPTLEPTVLPTSAPTLEDNPVTGSNPDGSADPIPNRCFVDGDDDDDLVDDVEEEGVDDSAVGRLENPPCSVCGDDDQTVTDYPAVFEWPGQPRTTCGLLQIDGAMGHLPADYCSLLPDLIQEICRCQPIPTAG